MLIEHGKSRSLSLASFLHVRYPFDRNLVEMKKRRKRMKKKKDGRYSSNQRNLSRINKNARFRGGKHNASRFVLLAVHSTPSSAGLALVQSSSLSLSLSRFARNRGNFCLINDIGFGIFPLPFRSSKYGCSLHRSRDPFRVQISWKDSSVSFFPSSDRVLSLLVSSFLTREIFF